MTNATPSTRPRNFTTWADFQIRRLRYFTEEVGESTLLAGRTFRTMFTTRFDLSEFIYQLEQLGVRSLAIAAATAIFVGIVMTIQFAVSMEATSRSQRGECRRAVDERRQRCMVIVQWCDR